MMACRSVIGIIGGHVSFLSEAIISKHASQVFFPAHNSSLSLTPPFTFTEAFFILYIVQVSIHHAYFQQTRVC